MPTPIQLTDQEQSFLREMAGYLNPGEELDVCPCGPQGSQGGLKVILKEGARKKVITQSRRGNVGRLRRQALQKFKKMGRGPGSA